MDILEQAKKLKRQLRKTPKTAAELSTELGYKGGGRAVGRALKVLVESGDATKDESRPPKYAKV